MKRFLALAGVAAMLASGSAYAAPTPGPGGGGSGGAALFAGALILGIAQAGTERREVQAHCPPGTAATVVHPADPNPYDFDVPMPRWACVHP